MRTAPQLEDCQLVSCHDGAQTDRFKPACSGTNIDNVKPYMTDSDRWSLIGGIWDGFSPQPAQLGCGLTISGGAGGNWVSGPSGSKPLKSAPGNWER